MTGDMSSRWITETVVAVGLMIASSVAAAVLSTAGGPPRPIDAVGFGLIALACGALALRHRFPVTVLATSSVAVASFLMLRYPYSPVLFAVSLSVYTVTRRNPTPRALLLSAGAYALLVASTLVHPEALPGLFGPIVVAAWIVIPATIGISRRLVVEARLRERAATERRLRDEERLRIANEVHDVVGHGLTAIQMQADIALHVARQKPEQCVQALTAISSASAAALAELRDTLSSVDPAPRDDAPRVPVACLDNLEELCDRIRAAGVDVRLSISGTPHRLPSDVDLAAYRIVQESLTNVVKHAIAPQAAVELTYAPDTIAVIITSPHDDTTITEGFGMRGIRRRVASLGGTLRIRTGTTLCLHAVLPETRPVGHR